MSYFLSDRPLRPGLTVALDGEEARHLLGARRTHAGERFALQDPQGQRFEAEVLEVQRRQATVRVLSSLPVPAPPSLPVRLLQAAVKEKAADQIVQRATELGVAALCFFPAERSTVAHRALAGPGALVRWERIAWEACKQCDRAAPPELCVVPGLAEVLQTAEVPGPAAPLRLLLHGEADATLAATLHRAGTPAPAGVHLLVGPEGGFSGEERQRAAQAGFVPVRLGATTLRAETAALAACSVALYGRA